MSEKIKTITLRTPELGCWVVAEFNDGEDQLPTITPFNTKKECDEYRAGKKPSKLTLHKLVFERLPKRGWL